MEELRVGWLRFSAHGIAEVAPDGHGCVFVPRGDIRSIALASGLTSAWPTLALAAGGGLALFVGFVFVRTIPQLVAFGLPFYLAVVVAELLVLLPAFLAAVFVRDGLRTGAYLRVETPRGVEKLRLGSPSHPQLEATLARARELFDYPAR
jgi:hypothetical protein